MFVHTVLFWLKDELSPEERNDFTQGLSTLKEIQPNVMISVGTPADTHRPIIDRSYDFGLNCVFNSKDDQDQYQEDPIHLEFLKNHGNKWKKVLIYDFD